MNQEDYYSIQFQDYRFYSALSIGCTQYKKNHQIFEMAIVFI